MTLAGPPPPAGVIVFNRPPARRPSAFAQLHNIRAYFCHIHSPPCTQRIGAILDQRYPSARPHTILNSSIGAAHSSSQRPSIWIGDTPPPGCRSEQSDARWISSPSERCLFFGPESGSRASLIKPRLAMRSERHPVCARRDQACTPCMGAMQHCLCNFCSKRLYSRSSDDGQQER